MRIARIAFALAVLMPGAALAQSTPAQKPDFSPFTFLTGAWSCTPTASPNRGEIGRPTPITFAVDRSGFWLVGTEPHTKRYVSHDAKTSTWYSVALTERGGMYSDRSTGWSGNRLVLHDTFNSDGSPLGTTTITKASDHRYTVRDSEGFNVVCTKP